MAEAACENADHRTVAPRSPAAAKARRRLQLSSRFLALASLVKDEPTLP
jgi:hypothetical protein